VNILCHTFLIIGVALIDGNKNNRQSSVVNAELSGAYFGTAAAIRSLASLAGLSNIFVNILALSFATAISEFIKIRSSNIISKQTRVGNGPTMYQLMKFKNPSMLDLMKFAKNENVAMTPRMKMMGEITQIEIYADLVKYFLIYVILSRDSLHLMNNLEDAVVIGCVAGITSQLVREQKDREVQDSIDSMNRRMKEERKKQKQTNNKKKMSTRNTLYNPSNSPLWMNKLQLLEGQFYPFTDTSSSLLSSSKQEFNNKNRNKYDEKMNDSKDIIIMLPKMIKQYVVDLQERFADTAIADEKFSRSIFPFSKIFNTEESSSLLDRQQQQDEQQQEKILNDNLFIRLSRSALECAVQLLTYEAARRYVMEVSPYFQREVGLDELSDFFFFN
jgi:hypothetical protein